MMMTTRPIDNQTTSRIHAVTSSWSEASHPVSKSVLETPSSEDDGQSLPACPSPSHQSSPSLCAGISRSGDFNMFYDTIKIFSFDLQWPQSTPHQTTNHPSHPNYTFACLSPHSRDIPERLHPSTTSALSRQVLQTVRIAF